MRRLFIPLMLAVLMIALILNACAAPAAPTTPTTPTTPTAPTTPTPTEPTQPSTTIPPEPAGKFPQPNYYWGVGFKPDGTPYKFGCAVTSLALDTWNILNTVPYSGLQRSGAEVTFSNAEWNLDTQIAQIEDLIVSGVDGLACHAVNTSGTAPAINKAGELGIPTFTYDIPIESDYVVSHAGYDNYEQGVLCADALIEIAERMDTKLYAYELWCPMSVKVCSDRDDAFMATVAGHPLIEVIQGPPTEALDELALQAIEDAFPAQPELNAIVLMGGMMDGTTQALNNLGRLKPVGDPDHVVFVTINGPVLENIRKGYMDICIGSPVWEMSDAATKLMLNYICLGKPVEPVYYMPIHTITTENVDEMPFWVRWADVLDDNPEIETWPILDMAEVGYPEITMPTVK